jgi:hypothetical protein
LRGSEAWYAVYVENLTAEQITASALVVARSRAMSNRKLKYVSDESGKNVAVIVPMDVWKDISSELETAYLLSSPAMRDRLLKARDSKEDIPFEVVREKLGI